MAIALLLVIVLLSVCGCICGTLCCGGVLGGIACCTCAVMKKNNAAASVVPQQRVSLAMANGGMMNVTGNFTIVTTDAIAATPVAARVTAVECKVVA
jgi:hypothetical protein